MKDIFYFKVGRRHFSAFKQVRDNKNMYLINSRCRFGCFKLRISEEDYNNIENKDIQSKVAKLWVNAYV